MIMETKNKSTAIVIYTISEAAKLLRIKKNKLYDLIYTGEINAFRISERGMRVSEQALLVYITRKEKQMIG